MPIKKSKTDKELVCKYINGDESALAIIIERHKHRIYSYIYNAVKDKALAEDIFQETFFKVILTIKKGEYKEEGKFLPWIIRIAHNIIMDTFRLKKRMPTISGGVNDQGKAFDIFDVLVLKDEHVGQRIEKKQSLKEIRQVIKFLPEEQKEIIMMRLYYGMSFKEISERKKIGINTALGRMRYAVLRIRKIISEKEMEMSFY